MAILYSNKKKKSSSLWVFVLVLVLLGILPFAAKLIQPLSHRIFGNVFNKTQDIQGVLMDTSDRFKHSKASLVQEIELLKKQNEELVLFASNQEQIKKENEELRALLGRIGEKPNRVLADVIAKPNQSPYDTLVARVDGASPISQGMLVLSDPETVLGKVNYKEGNNLMIDMFSKSGTETVGRLERNNQDVKLIGRGGGNFIVEVPNELEVLAGDRILYPEYNNTVLGVVRSISNDDRNPNKILYVTTFINILELNRVYVVLP